MKLDWKIEPKAPIGLMELAGLIASGKVPTLDIPIPMIETHVYPDRTETEEFIPAGPVTKPEPDRLAALERKFTRLESALELQIALMEKFQRAANGNVNATRVDLALPITTQPEIKIGQRVRVYHGRTNPHGLEGIVYGVYPNPQYTTVYATMDNGERLKDYARNLRVI